MPTIETSALGISVSLDELECELKKLWEQSGGTKMRASLVNLAIYSEEADSLARNTEIISQVTENLACRALLINVERSAKTDRVEAWINAHCHSGADITRQVCSEQVSFHIEGPCVRLLANIVFSHLDSDLPFYLWWQGEFHDPMDAELWSWVDRLIYDSQSWRDFSTQRSLLEDAIAEAKGRVVLCDLNWTRLTPIRSALAQFFDHPASHHHLQKINSLEINFGPGYRSTALLLAGWLAAQLKWKASARELRFSDERGNAIAISLQEEAGEPISRCILRSEQKEFSVVHAKDADLLEVSSWRHGGEAMQQLMPALATDPATLLNEELTRGGAHRIYLRALDCVKNLL